MSWLALSASIRLRMLWVYGYYKYISLSVQVSTLSIDIILEGLEKMIIIITLLRK